MQGKNSKLSVCDFKDTI